MTIAQRLVTAEDLAALAARDDGQARYELIAGELAVMSPAKPRHGRIIGRFTSALGPFVLDRSLGEVFGAETGFLLGRHPDTVRAPDVAFVRRERVLAVGDTDDWWPGAPDLAVEVLSPDDTYSEVRQKVGLWLGAGARMVLVVDPRRRVVEVHRAATPLRELTEADVLEGEEVVPGWSLPVARLFETPVGDDDASRATP
jgi:Uma2 family endonuclease